MAKNRNLLGHRVILLPSVDPEFKFKTTWKDNEFIGAEFEIEGYTLPDDEDLKYHWRAIVDDSLRPPPGPDGMAREYLLKKPVSPETFKDKCFPYLLKSIERTGGKTEFSVRCSTHVHVGVHQLYYYQVFLMMGLYFVFEDLFYPLVGKDRDGGLFCVGSNTSEAMVNAISYLLTNGGEFRKSGVMIGSSLKYSSVNLITMSNLGTIEFRAMEGTVDKERIYLWLDILVALRDYASTITPQQASTLLNNMSMEGPVDMLARILGGKHRRTFKYILESFDNNEDLVKGMVYAGIGRAQELFYEPDWMSLVLVDEVDIASVKKSTRYGSSIDTVPDNYFSVESQSQWD